MRENFLDNIQQRDYCNDRLRQRRSIEEHGHSADLARMVAERVRDRTGGAFGVSGWVVVVEDEDGMTWSAQACDDAVAALDNRPEAVVRIIDRVPPGARPQIFDVLGVRRVVAAMRRSGFHPELQPPTTLYRALLVAGSAVLWLAVFGLTAIARKTTTGHESLALFGMPAFFASGLVAATATSANKYIEKRLDATSDDKFKLLTDVVADELAANRASRRLNNFVDELGHQVVRLPRPMVLIVDG